MRGSDESRTDVAKVGDVEQAEDADKSKRQGRATEARRRTMDSRCLGWSVFVILPIVAAPRRGCQGVGAAKTRGGGGRRQGKWGKGRKQKKKEA